jgi:type VI secretion system protein ImpA
MASTPIIDIDELLQPISEAQPQGSDAREDGPAYALYSQLKDARNKARSAERASLFDPDQASNILNEWRPILSIAPSLLQQHTKDLEVAAWLIEALIRFHDFAGLRDGIALARGLVEKYWDTLYPLPDEDGLETKVAPLAGLNGDSSEGTLLAPIRNTPITPDTASGCFSFWQYQQARDADKIADPDKKEEKEQALGFSLRAIEAAVSDGSSNFFRDLVDDLEQAVNDFRSMNDTLRKHCGHQAPPYSLILETLEEVLRSVRFLAKDKLASTESAAAETSTDTGAAAPAVRSTGAAGSSGPIANREDALRRLEEVARFFRATEPHTPLVTGIERLVRWGRMPMADLILELVPDPTARAFYQHLTGANLEGGTDAAASYAATASIAATATPTPAATEHESMKW